MGKFISTTYKENVEEVSQLYNTLLTNNLYKFSDKKPVIATYYNLNKDYSSLDPGSKLTMDYKEDDTSLRWNRVYDMLLYAFPHFEMNTSIEEFGLEADRFEGETYILPNTIVPYEGDFFEIEHITSSSWLFVVKDVQRDTLENGANVYKISFKLDAVDRRQITDHIIHNYRYFEKREGSNLASVVRCEDFDVAYKMDRKCSMLKNYFEELFYDKKVQTFIFFDLTNIHLYDTMMIEFLIKNRILDNGGDHYIHVTHQIEPPATISLTYDHTFFRAFELKDLDKLNTSIRSADVREIRSYGTTFSSRYEMYYETVYVDKQPGYAVEALPDDLYGQIIDNVLDENPLQGEKSTLWKNILIKYFRGDELTEEEINSVDDMRFDNSRQAFYVIPLVIFCLERYIEKILD